MRINYRKKVDEMCQFYSQQREKKHLFSEECFTGNVLHITCPRTIHP